MKTWGSGGITPTFLTSALDGGEGSASRFSSFTPGERAPNRHLGPRAGLEAVKKKINLVVPGIELGPSSP
jgi:hypothetical protein